VISSYGCTALTTALKNERAAIVAYLRGVEAPQAAPL
jgi:hypothetical protein